ncbi:tetraspanin-10 isoform X1 [Trichosurus vulpecula]|uniref:tetraspanin-10 isoform X1 n=1 Tax=Trichosurus vulpecula TaxID=9337 RepID=UPI00186B2E11|nr:tetraspanin-10 isoform X1 [Trichosurus vulpecula]
MVEGERTQLLPKEAGCDEPPSLSCNYTVRVLEPIPKKYNAGPSGWGCLPPGDKWHSALPLQGGLPLPLNFWSSCIKYLIFLLNFLFSLLGLLTLVVGLWGLTDKESLGSEQLPHLGTDPMLLFVVVGLTVSIVSLAGCIGALCESICLLWFFAGGILTFLILETLAGILIYALWDQLQEIVDSTMLLAITRYQDDSDLRFLLDEIQLGLQCYGVVSYQDWKLNLYFNCSSPGVQACGLPASCCINPWENGTIINSQCGFGALHLDETTAQNIVHSEGCSPRLRQWLGRNSWVIRDCILVITVIEGLEFLLVTKLVRDIKVRKVND